MAETIITPNMGLPNPIPSVAPSPAWAQDLSDCMVAIDGHTHVPGSGIPVTPGGLNINADLPFNDNNATSMRSVRMQPQSAPLALATDLGCLYESGVDLYYNDGNGNQVRITASGNVVGTAGSITGLVSPASATYVPGDETFVWQSDVNTPANMDMASAILRNLTANSHSYELTPPASLGADFTLTLPAIGTAGFVKMDASGVQSTQAQIQTADIAALAITTAKIANGAVTTTQISNGTVKQSNMAILNPAVTVITPAAFTGSGSDVTIATATAFTSHGGAISITFSNGALEVVAGGAFSGGSAIYTIKRNGTAINAYRFSGIGAFTAVPIGCLNVIDNPGAGTYTYTLAVRNISTPGPTAGIVVDAGTQFAMWIYEL